MPDQPNDPTQWFATLFAASQEMMKPFLPGGGAVQSDMVFALLCLVLIGGFDMLSVYVRSSLVQLHTPARMRGRVSAVSGLAISASNELGEVQSGIAAAALGPVGAVVFGGVAAGAIALAWAKVFPELRRAKNFDPPDIVDTMPSAPPTAVWPPARRWNRPCPPRPRSTWPQAWTHVPAAAPPAAAD